MTFFCKLSQGPVICKTELYSGVLLFLIASKLNIYCIRLLKVHCSFFRIVLQSPRLITDLSFLVSFYFTSLTCKLAHVYDSVLCHRLGISFEITNAKFLTGFYTYYISAKLMSQPRICQIIASKSTTWGFKYNQYVSSLNRASCVYDIIFVLINT